MPDETPTPGTIEIITDEMREEMERVLRLQCTPDHHHPVMFTVLGPTEAQDVQGSLFRIEQTDDGWTFGGLAPIGEGRAVTLQTRFRYCPSCGEKLADA